ncbi:MAG TPA: putative LPS assembly protein LptD [Puia sp.]|nr:putative LPS assembly protein LptD [Puia sp.]
MKDSLLKDTSQVQKDTLRFKTSKDSLDAPVDYSASDSVVLNVPGKTITLYDKANIKYKGMTLDAYTIQFDQPKQIVVATFTTDTAGKIIGKPKMVDKESTMESDSIVYSLKTQKGITRNTFTQSGEMFVLGEKMKKISPTEYYAYRGRFTTCNLDTPHFAFRTNKLKLINQKMAISGPIHPEFEGVPIPIYLPFGFFPISQGRHSGLLPPAFNASPQFGLGLEGLGYYKVLSDNFDITTRVNLYSYGGWNLFITPEYKVRYRFSGRVNLALQDTRILSNSGQVNYEDTKTYSFSWSHTVDSKARPGQSFSANVNLASTQYNKYILNNPALNFSNQLSSSIAYSKTWNGKLNLTISGSHNQNNQTRLINVNLPNIGFTATTFYPFQDKDFVGTPKWYQKLGVGLNSTITGQSSFYDSLFSFHQMIDTFQWGAQHNIPITLSLPSILGGALQIAPGVSFQNRMYSKKFIRSWDSVAQKVDSSYMKGFYSASYVSFSLNLSTALFGTFTNFGKNSNILGIRHVMRPTIGLTYTPDLNSKYYYQTQVSPKGYYGNVQTFNVFEGSPYGGFSQGTFGGISFGLDNNLEMKVKSKSDTSDTGSKKVKLIDGFGFTGSYNYLADSFKLSPISLYFRSTLFTNVNITGGATLDPYVTDTAGFRRNIYAWDNPGHKFSLGRITGGNVAISTSFKSKPKDAKKAEESKQLAENQLPMTVEEQQAQLEYIRANPAEFADFNVAWSLNLSYSLSFSSVLRPDYSGYSTQFNSSLTINGDFNLTEKWKVGFSSYYDVKNLKIQSLTTFLSRDLHCWQMSINITPVGPWRSFNITLSPKSGILQDLRVNRARTFQ